MADLGQQNIDMADVAEAFRDRRYWVGVGVVYSDNGSHYEIHEVDGNRLDVFVKVAIMPRGAQYKCRLASQGSGGGSGMWRIPQPDTEVHVLFPAGNYAWCPTIVAVGITINDSGVSLPDELDDQTLVIADDKAIIIRNNDGNITINAKSGNIVINASDQVKINGEDKQVAYKDGSVNGGTLMFVPGTGGATLTYVPYSPDGYGTIPPLATPVMLSGGAITQGSSKAKVGV